MAATLTMQTLNNQQVVLALGEDSITLRVQDLRGHNRAVAKLGHAQVEVLAGVLSDWLDQQ